MIDSPTLQLSRGYGSVEYVQSLSDFGELVELKSSGGWLLKRRIPDTPYYDAIGPYPLFCCHDWHGLGDDLDDLDDGSLISASIVVDPLAPVRHQQLLQWFDDRCIAFKQHLMVSLTQPIGQIVSPRHRTYARKAERILEIFRADDPRAYLDVWCEFYQQLQQRHLLSGISVFSRTAFEAQLALEEMSLFYAVEGSEIVAMQLWIDNGPTAYYHLGASGKGGYLHRASYGLMWHALQRFQAEGKRMANLGGSSGNCSKKDGLYQFKKGWSNHARTAWFCGRVLNRDVYDELVASHSGGETNIFPAYRWREFSEGQNESN